MQYIFESLMETPVGEELASDFFLKNLKKLIRKYGTGSSMKHAIRAVVTGVRSVDRFTKIKNFTKTSLGVADFLEGWTWRLSAHCPRPSVRCSGRQSHGPEVEKWLDEKMAKYPFLYEDVVRAMY
ncbi:hypothetical protein HPB52_011669 [Rhipicephalus sanguineus]|uniref:Uncharacterized protein n=1 Tax=Rhipicephalus sanguineus TaxID=34632 RepID=A0A9D4PMF9_RHISA|nr:hypothetical protein HPB52_011669 [Rhipicephalus sanguineus]